MKYRGIYCSIIVVGSILGGCGKKSNVSSSDDNAQVFEVHNPELGMTLGRGYAPEKDNPIVGDCIKNVDRFKTKSWKDHVGIKASLAETRIESHSDLLKESQLSVKGSVSYTFASGSGSYNRYDKFRSSEDTFTWLFHVEAEAGSETMKFDTLNFTKDDLTTQAKALYVANDKKGFYNLCGSQFIRSISYGGRIIDVHEINAKAVDQIHKMDSAVNASGGKGMFKASLSAQYSEAVNEAARNSMFKRDLYQEGGKQIKFELGPTTVDTTLKDFADGINADNSVVLSVETAPWETLLNWKPEADFDRLRDRQLTRLYNQYWANIAKIDKIEKYIYLYEQNSIQLSEKDKNYLVTIQKDIDDQQFDIIEKGSDCYKDSTTCKDAVVKEIVVTFPQLVSVQQPEQTMNMGIWSVSLPNSITMEKGSSQGDLSTWINNQVTLDTAHGDEDFMFEFDEDSCGDGLFDRLEARGGKGTVLTTSLGKPLPYSESTKDRYGKKYSQIVFGYQKNRRCFFASFRIENGKDGFGLKEDSLASKTILKIARSIN